ncbi:MAG: PD-(D/E)XK nuclease family protein [Ardenticatenaceae bacterium]|nr:PD-(D/E)XK nuclease family protein [Ardenticatenaceae bacterium]
MQYLAAHLFDLDPPRVPIASGRSGPGLAFVEAPDRAREARALARRVKQLLHAGTPPDEIAVLFYTLDPWAGLVREAFAEFELPLALTGGHPLVRTPVVVALLRALDAAEQRFERRTVLDLWTSPYLEPTPLAPAQVQLAAALAAEALVTAGRDAWQRALIPSDWVRDFEDPDAGPPLVNRQAPAALAGLGVALDTFFQILTPPARGTPRTLARWVERLIGDDPAAEEVLSEPPLTVEAGTRNVSLHVIRRVRALDDAALVARDLAALETFLRLLRGYVEGAELAGVEEVSWADFRAELDALLANATFQVQPPGGVLVATIFEARGLPRRHILIGGLSEGEFPPPPPINPLFSQTDQALLEGKNLLLPTDYAARDRAAFLEAASLASESLTFSRTYLDDRGNQWPPSSFWTSVAALFEGLEQHTRRLPIGHVPALAEVATPAEWLVAAAVALRERRPGAEGAHNALLGDAALAAGWRTALGGHRIERQREGSAPHDRFEGVLREPALVAEVRRQLRRRRWSASAFNDLGVCGFRFYARRLLQVQAPEDPEAGPDARQIGSIQHELLEHTYWRLAAHGLAVTPATLPDVLLIFEQEAAPLLESAPQRHRFHATALWPYQQIEIRKRLERFLGWEAEQNARREVAPQPYRVEVPFGLQGTSPLHLPAPWGRLEVIGLIDRIDRLPGGVVITDYKSGGREIPVDEMLAARNVQMAIYVRAAEKLFAADGLPVREARFVHLRGPKTSGELDEATTAIRDLVDQAEAALTGKLAAAWDGNFAVRLERFEGGRCAHHCEYAAMCRAQRASDKAHGER